MMFPFCTKFISVLFVLSFSFLPSFSNAQGDVSLPTLADLVKRNANRLEITIGPESFRNISDDKKFQQFVAESALGATKNCFNQIVSMEGKANKVVITTIEEERCKPNPKSKIVDLCKGLTSIFNDSLMCPDTCTPIPTVTVPKLGPISKCSPTMAVMHAGVKSGKLGALADLMGYGTAKSVADLPTTLDGVEPPKPADTPPVGPPPADPSGGFSEQQAAEHLEQMGLPKEQSQQLAGQGKSAIDAIECIANNCGTKDQAVKTLSEIAQNTTGVDPKLFAEKFQLGVGGMTRGISKVVKEVTPGAIAETLLGGGGTTFTQEPVPEPGLSSPEVLREVDEVSALSRQQIVARTAHAIAEAQGVNPEAFATYGLALQADRKSVV